MPPRLALTLLLLTLVPGHARATLVRQLDTEALTHAATIIAHGTINTAEARTDDGFGIVTEHTLTVVTPIKGTQAGAQHTFVVLGGELGEYRQVVAGEAHFEVGEDVLVFLQPRPDGHLTVVGMSQGKFRIALDDAGTPIATSDTHDLSFARVQPVVLDSGAVRQEVVRVEEAQPLPSVPLDAFIAEIRTHLAP